MDCPEGYVHKGEQGPTIVTEVGVFPALLCDENVTLHFKGSVTGRQGEKLKRNFSLMFIASGSEIEMAKNLSVAGVTF